MKKFMIGIATAALVAGPALAADGIDVTKHRQAVTDMLADKGVKWSQVEKVVVEPIYGNGPLTDVIAFVHMAECKDGYIVVRLDKTANVRQAYTRNDCKIRGFDNYS